MRRAHTLTGDADGAHASHLAGSHLAGSQLAGSHLIWPDLIWPDLIWPDRISSGRSSSPVLVAGGSYHSLYPWHDAGCYARLESEYDRVIKGWMKHDLYAKRDVLYSAAELAQLRA
jgi:hypothetical protein